MWGAEEARRGRRSPCLTTGCTATANIREFSRGVNYIENPDLWDSAVETIRLRRERRNAFNTEDVTCQCCIMNEQLQRSEQCHQRMTVPADPHARFLYCAAIINWRFVIPTVAIQIYCFYSLESLFVSSSCFSSILLYSRCTLIIFCVIRICMQVPKQCLLRQKLTILQA